MGSKLQRAWVYKGHRVKFCNSISNVSNFVPYFENLVGGGGNMDVSGRILRAWMPAIHAGMTDAADGQTPLNIGVGVEGYTSIFILCGRA